MIKWPLKPKVDDLVGIELRDDGIAIAHRQNTDKGNILKHVDFLPSGIDNTTEQLLCHYVKQNNLQKLSCNVVLPQGHYQLLLVDAPEVPDAEMRSALRWKIKDLISTPLEDCIIDFFRLPDDGAHLRKKMVYAVIVDTVRLKAIIDLIKKSDLQLKAIDVSDLVMRNLATNLIDPKFDGRGVAIARLRQGRGGVGLFKKGNLYLSRQFDLDYGAGLLEDLPADILTLELQRSLDYYERQMGQAAPSVVYICGDGVTEDKITDSLRASLASSIQYLDVGAVVGLPADVDLLMLQKCLGAIGGSLRTEFEKNAAD